MKSGVERQALPANIGLWPIHISALFMGIILLMRERSSGRKIKSKFPSLRRNVTSVNYAQDQKE